MPKLSREQIIRVLRAKEHELEGRALSSRELDDLGYLAADVGLLFGLLADHLEDTPDYTYTDDRVSGAREGNP